MKSVSNLMIIVDVFECYTPNLGRHPNGLSTHNSTILGATEKNLHKLLDVSLLFLVVSLLSHCGVSALW